MSNHCHTILKINAPLAQSWSDEEVIQRCEQLFLIPTLVERYLNGLCHSDAEKNKAKETISLFRERLMDISWFMRCLNEYIARKANVEDQCTGRFWEGRFKSQALLDEQAILSCMVYVDLNLIRAELCDTLDQSDYTSIQQRIEEFNAKKISSNTPAPRTSSEIKLATFTGNSLNENGIAFSLTDYLELADWTGQIVREDKRGYIKPTTPGILQKLQLDEQTWMDTVQGFSKGFYSFIGPEQQLKSLCQKQNRHWVRGINICRKLFKLKQPFPVPL